MRLKMMGGGGSVDYDDLTATVADVPEGLTFIGHGSEDDQIGTLPNMENKHGSVGLASDTDVPVHNAESIRIEQDESGDMRIALCPTRGKYPGSNRAFIGCYPLNLGITPDVIANGQTVGGVVGTYGSDATAKSTDLRPGKVAYNENGRIVGDAYDAGQIVKTLGAGESYTIKEGFYGSGKITAKDLASQTSGNIDSGHVVSGYSGYANGKKVDGSIKDCGPYQIAGGIGEAGDYYAFNNAPSGWYHEDESNSSWAPELRLSKNTVRNYLGITAGKIVNGQTIAGIAGNGGYASIACIASHSANVGGNRDSDGRKSFRMPRAGRVFYGGATAGTSGSFLCAIFKNGTCVDDRNMRTSGYAHGYGDYAYRGSMFNCNFYANAGDLIEVETSYGGSNTQSSIQAVIVY